MKSREYLKFEYLKAKYRFKSKHLLFTERDKKNPPFFILAAGRSGTTLLRTILSRNNTLVIPPESNDLIPVWITKFLENQNKDWDSIIDILLDDFNRIKSMKYWNVKIQELKHKLKSIPKSQQSLHLVIEKLYKFNQPNANSWGDKTPYLTFALPYLNYLFPNAKIIFLIRDGRDVIRSRMKARTDATLNNSAEKWICTSKIILEYCKNKPSSLCKMVKYEDLVTQTEVEIKSICDFLEITFLEELLDQSKTLNLGDTVLKHHKNTKNPINTDSIGKWETFFSAEQKVQLNNLLKQQILEFGYSTPTPH